MPEREKASEHLRNAMVLLNADIDNRSYGSDAVVAADVVAARDRIQAALDIIEEIKNHPAPGRLFKVRELL